MMNKNMLNHSIQKDSGIINGLIKSFQKRDGSVENPVIPDTTLTGQQNMNLCNKLKKVFVNLKFLENNLQQKHTISGHLDTSKVGDEWQSNIMYYRGYGYFLETAHRCGITNGYVIIQPNQKGYNFKGMYEESNINCYCGITFDENSHVFNKNHKFKHLVRIIGFDVDHLDDYVPENACGLYTTNHEHSIHWTDKMLIKQCKHIIDQLHYKKIEKDPEL